MEALSPRTTNQLIKPKASTDGKMGDKQAVTTAPKSSSASKNHADPPPSIVTEPEEEAEQYHIGGFLGKGGFAVCYEGTLARNGRVFAMKVVKSKMPQKKMEEKVQRLSHGDFEWRMLIFTSFVQSYKSIQKCATPLSFSSIAPSPLNKAHMSSLSCARMGQ